MPRSGTVLVLAVASLTLSITATAQAGTVGRLFNPDDGYDGVSFDASPGERNNVTVRVAAKSVTIADSGAPLTVQAGSGCAPIDAHSAHCPRRPHVLIDLGDNADKARLSYSAPARGDLAEVDFAEVDGGPGNDTLIGGSQVESLDGGPGADVIEGGAGSDDITGGEGPDALRGGPGNDTMNVHDYKGAPSDEVACGPGHDGINYDVDPTDIIHRDCETVAGDLPLTPSFGSRTSGSYRVPCKRIGNGRPSSCSAHVVLTDRAGRRLAEGRGTLRTAPYRGIRARTSYLRVSVRLTRLGQLTLGSAKPIVIAEQVAFYERIPGSETTRENFRYRVAWS
jgi:hemolysin type calcium-binding protein